MPKSNAAANVIDFEAFRQRKLREERPIAEAVEVSNGPAPQPLLVPVWFCWVPMWSPVVG
ncbi:MAG TPA: hypothetical protein VM925_32780 [Labilithrix sp.]|nr:hypothetical protein [Labilithrix sp.]